MIYNSCEVEGNQATVTLTLQMMAVSGLTKLCELQKMCIRDRASQTLLAFGTSAEDLLPTLQMLGDVSQGPPAAASAMERCLFIGSGSYEGFSWKNQGLSLSGSRA